jgi:TRAP-type mannitol/chloroaromatic compound transport system permease small subunit
MNLDRLLDLAYGLARVGAWFGGALIVAAALLVGVEVVIRKAFTMTIGGADELSGYALAIATTWGLAFTLLERAHVRIDSLYIHLPVRLAAILDLIGLALFIGFFSLVTWHGWGVFATSVRLDAHSMSPLGTPLVIPQALWIAGLILFLLIAALLLVRALVAFVQGDLGTMRRLVGSRTLTEEMAAELERPDETAESERGIQR